ncbi:MAG: hypothetical protein KF773_41750 [Deltaproteobacteria bacterium]|nr:hypothetical protein [Deltaproteobacteria bacterium]MCW5809273.1 hypothetical protein [Deltaproteobacteria bacterium]
MLRRLTAGFLTVVVLVLAWFCIANALWPPINAAGKQLPPTANLLRALACGAASSALLGLVVWRRGVRARRAEQARLATAVASYRERR